jgi:hypothetical protein
MSRFSIVFPATVILAVTGCASMPNGPSVMVMPSPGIPFEQFRNDDAICQQFAFSQVGGTSSDQAAMDSGVTSAIVGTAIGAAVGAAFGGGRGAAIGAGSGLLAGGLIGTGTASSSMNAGQQRYDAAYIQCMYTKGHQVPVSGQFSGEIPQRVEVPSLDIPPPSGSTSPTYIPPPPSGPPPAPPPQ